MHCNDFDIAIDDWLDRTLNDRALDAVEQHLAQCSRCRERADRAQALQAQLRALPTPAMPEDLPERLLGGEVRGKMSRYGRGFAIAASLCLAVTAALMLDQRDARQTDSAVAENVNVLPQQWVSLAVAEPRNVRLALSAAADLENATLTIVLPDGVEFQGHPGRRQLSWTASLRQGENRLVLPLIATARRDSELVLRIEHGDKYREMRVGIHANGKVLSMERQDSFRGSDTV